jgi:hypothetical protein
MDIDAIKKTAKAESRRNGTSHQAELNAIAAANGYTHWGAFASALADADDALPVGSYMNDDFTPARAFLPIGHAPRDGTRLLVVGGSTYAAACWRSGMWTYPSGERGEPEAIVQLDFEPTHYARRDDADAARGAMAATTPKMLRGLVERVEGVPTLELEARMMLGAQMHLHAAESFAKWNEETGPRPPNPTTRPEGMTDREWLESLTERAERVDIDPEALRTFRSILAKDDFAATVARNDALVRRMRSS